MVIKRSDSDSNNHSPVVPDLFDVRLRLRNLSLGRITLKQLEKYLADLPDDTANAEFVKYDNIVHGEEEAQPDSAPGAHAGEGGFAH